MSHDPIQEHLDRLAAGLADQTPKVVEDAVWRERIRIQQALDRLSWTDPGLDAATAITQALEHLDDPPSAAKAPPFRWPTFFGVYREPRTWSSFAFLLLCLPMGIAAFTWAVTGLSLSLGLLPIFVGLPMLAAFLLSCRAWVNFETHMAASILGTPAAYIPALPKGPLLQRLGNLFRSSATWSSLTYLVLLLPLGIVDFTLSVTCLATFGGITLMPLAYAHLKAHPNPESLWLLEHSFMPLYGPGHPAPMGFVLLVAFLGFLGLTASLHLILALGRLHGRILKLATFS